MKAPFFSKATFNLVRFPQTAALLCALAALYCGQAESPLAPTATPPPPLALSPSNPQIAQGTAQQFTVRGLHPNGHRPDLTQVVHFFVTGADGGPVPMAAAGLLQLEQPGRYMVSADYQGQSVTTMITVTAAKLTTLALTPKTPRIAKGLSQAFTATAGFSDGTTQNVTTSTTWSAKDLVGSGVVLLSSKGVATAKNVGQASITARYKTFSATTTLTVTAATLSTLQVSPTNPTLIVAGSLTFTAQGVFSDGSVQDVTAAADWGVTDVVGSGVASITGSTVVADSVGQATVSAFYQGVETDTTLTVVKATLSALAISPLNPSLNKGATQQFTATGTYSDGTTKDVTAAVSWTTTDIAPAMGVATIDAMGLATANQGGSALVKASYSGFTASTTLTVISAAWAPQTSGTANDLIDVWGSDSKNLWAVSDKSGTILQWNGASWTSVASPAIQFQGVWGTSANNVWAVGLSGTILHWNGTAWTAQASGIMSALLGVWGTSASNVWAVGQFGTILHWDGTAWAAQASGTTSDITRLWGSGANNVWAVGVSGTILHWNGATWATQVSGSAEVLTGVWGSDASNVWATGTGGTLLHWDGAAWSTRSSGLSGQYVRVWGIDANNAWIVGADGTILRWNGATWTAQSSGTAQILTGVWGTDANNVWVVGYGGTILKWAP